MPLTWKDRIKVASATTGTGTLTLGAAASGYRTFAAGDDGKLFAYVIEDGTAWETGWGTYTHSGTTFARTARKDSSTGSAISCTGAENLFVDLIAESADISLLGSQAITPGGRLTLESGAPVSITDQTAKTSIFYTPYLHNIINLFDGNVWKTIVFSEYTLALGTLSSGFPYDVFAYLSSGALAMEVLVWTSFTVRATAITLQDGRYCKSGDKTRLYIGSFLTTSTTTTEDSKQNRDLFNMYNRTMRQGYVQSTSSHTYNSATVRAWNNNTANRIAVMAGVAMDAVVLLMSDTTPAASSFPTVRGILDWSSGSGAAYDEVFYLKNMTSNREAFNLDTERAIPVGWHYITLTEEENNSQTNTYSAAGLTASWLI